MADQILSDGDQDMPFNKHSMRRNLVPTAKLVDANNVAQPGLTSQQKAIDNFRATQGTRNIWSSTRDGTVIVPGEAPSSSATTAASLRRRPAEISHQPSGQILEKRHISEVTETSDTNNSDAIGMVRRGQQCKKGTQLFHVEILFLIIDIDLAKKNMISGNPDAVDAEGFLADIDVQSIDEDEGPADIDRTQDVKEFFHEPFTKEVTGKDGKKRLKLYRKCKHCP